LGVIGDEFTTRHKGREIGTGLRISDVSITFHQKGMRALGGARSTKAATEGTSGFAPRGDRSTRAWRGR
jgi:hypothetical protein